jgi:hypothetical protein
MVAERISILLRAASDGCAPRRRNHRTDQGAIVAGKAETTLGSADVTVRATNCGIVLLLYRGEYSTVTRQPWPEHGFTPRFTLMLAMRLPSPWPNSRSSTLALRIGERGRHAFAQFRHDTVMSVGCADHRLTDVAWPESLSMTPWFASVYTPPRPDISLDVPAALGGSEPELGSGAEPVPLDLALTRYYRVRQRLRAVRIQSRDCRQAACGAYFRLEGSDFDGSRFRRCTR